MTPNTNPLPSRVLVTGAAGFVGSRLVAELLRRRDDLVVDAFDDLFTGRWDNLPDSDRIVRHEATVTDADAVREVISKVDLVFHLAARNIIASTADPRSDFETNVGGTLEVLLAARDLGRKKVVYASSASVYGNPRHLPIHEEEGVSTLSPYAVSKLAGENYCRAFFESYGLPTVCLRYSNVFGPGQDPRNPYCGVIGRFIQRALAGEAIEIHGDGEQTRDFTFIDDTVDATIAAAVSSRADGFVFNVASGIETSVNRLTRAILEATGNRSSVEYVPRRDIDNIRRRVLNVEHIRRSLRWTPSWTLEAALERTVEWYEGGDPAA